MITEHYYIRDGFVAYLDNYVAPFSSFELSLWKDRLQNNQALVPEIVGMLIGRAYPVYKKANCKNCKKEITEAESVEAENLYSPEKRLAPFHKHCYEELKAKEQETTSNN